MTDTDMRNQFAVIQTSDVEWGHAARLSLCRGRLDLRERSDPASNFIVDGRPSVANTYW